MVNTRSTAKIEENIPSTFKPTGVQVPQGLTDQLNLQTVMALINQLVQ